MFNRRDFLKLASLTVATAKISGCGQESLSRFSNKSSKPNIVIIYTDDQGYGDLGCYGHPTIRTPNIDKMASEGLRFTDFYSTSAVCSPSRAALLTGRYPIRYGITRVFFPTSEGGLPADEVTIAKKLKSNGYRTAQIGKWHLGIHKGSRAIDHGFDYSYGLPYSNDMAAREGVTRDIRRSENPTPRGWNVPLMRNGEVIEQPVDQSTITKRYTKEAVDFINNNKNNPFLLYFAHTMPHTPLFRSKQFEDKSLRGLYGDVIEEIDSSVGQVIKALKDNGLDDNTFVFFASDNGPWLTEFEQGGSAGLLKGGKATTWEGGMRVPAIMWMPEKIKPGVTSQMASTLDIFPTVMKITGTPIDDELVLDGADITGLIFDRKQLPERAFVYYWIDEPYACRIGDWKLHFITDGCPGVDQQRQSHDPPLLYNLMKDPSERFNRAEDYPELLKRLKKIASKQIAAVEHGPVQKF